MSDPIKSWLDAAGRYPVLSKEEVIYIARKIQAAEPGSREHTRLVNKLCLHNMRYAAKVTRAYMMSKSGLTWNSEKTADYLQISYFGMRRAAEKFDPTLGYTFSTYANAWIRQALGRYHVQNLSLIRVPESSAREIFYFENHGQPRNEKVAPWVEDAARSAARAYRLGSYDVPVDGTDGGMTLTDTLSEDNRLLSPSGEKHEFFSRLDTRGVMSSLGIRPQLQDMILAYVKRGNLDTVMMKNKCLSTSMRKELRSAIKLIQKHSGVAS